MKILVCYKDNCNTEFHTTIRMIIPKTWINQCFILNLMKLFIDTYNKAFSMNQLNELDLHFAMHWVDNITYIPIPYDGIISESIQDRATLFVRHNYHSHNNKSHSSNRIKSTTTADTKKGVQMSGCNNNFESNDVMSLLLSSTTMSTNTTTPDMGVIIKNDDLVQKEGEKVMEVTSNTDNGHDNTIPLIIFCTTTEISHIDKNDDNDQHSIKEHTEQEVVIDINVINGNDMTSVRPTISNDIIMMTTMTSNMEIDKTSTKERQQKVINENLIMGNDMTPVPTADSNDIMMTTLTSNTEKNNCSNSDIQDCIITYRSNANMSSNMKKEEPLIDHFRNILDWFGVPSNSYQKIVKDITDGLSLLHQNDNYNPKNNILIQKLGHILEESYANAMTTTDTNDPNQSVTSIKNTKTSTTLPPTIPVSEREPTTSPTLMEYEPNSTKHSKNHDQFDIENAGEEFEVIMNHSKQHGKLNKNVVADYNPTVVMNTKRGQRQYHHRHRNNDMKEKYHSRSSTYTTFQEYDSTTKIGTIVDTTTPIIPYCASQ